MLNDHLLIVFKILHENICYIQIVMFEILEKNNFVLFLQEDTVEAIIENLKKVDDDWSKKTVKLMGRMSPISMKVTLQMVRLGKELSLEDCLKMEYRLVRRCCQDSDFYEGTYT